MNKNENITFAEKHPKLNTFLGLLILLFFVAVVILILFYAIKYGIILLKGLAKFDAVVIVAIITGGVSITGVIISSIVGKSLEYKKSRNEYLTQKREEPYGEFVEMIYKVQSNSKNPGSYSEQDMIKDISKFSKQITLWGSPKVAKKWNEFRKNGANPENATQNLFLTEEIMNEMRKDLGVKKLNKGGLLGFFVNDIDNYIN